MLFPLTRPFSDIFLKVLCNLWLTCDIFVTLNFEIECNGIFDKENYQKNYKELLFIHRYQ
jgi:hypothetical protein